MKQYILKADVVAEIEKKLVDILACKKDASTPEERIALTNMLRLCKEILSFINTLEVKEVDLEKEIDKWYNNEASKEFENVLYKDIEKCAKHFFDLGLKTQKG